MKATLLYSAAVAAAIGCEALAIDVTSSSLSVSFDEQVKGAVARVVAVRGQELGAIKSHAPLFSLSLCRADSYTNIAYVSSADATDTVISPGVPTTVPGGKDVAFRPPSHRLVTANV